MEDRKPGTFPKRRSMAEGKKLKQAAAKLTRSWTWKKLPTVSVEEEAAAPPAKEMKELQQGDGGGVLGCALSMAESLKTIACPHGDIGSSRLSFAMNAECNYSVKWAGAHAVWARPCRCVVLHSNACFLLRPHSPR